MKPHKGHAALLISAFSLAFLLSPSERSFICFNPTQHICVDPDGVQGPTTPPNSTGVPVYYSVFNNTGTPIWLSFTCGSSGNVNCATVTPTSKLLSPSTTTYVTVTFTTTAAGTGTLVLMAQGGGWNDGGSYNITVAP
jgi:hypothetical protein